MQKNICCFAGHGKLVYGKNIRNEVFNKCSELITNCGVNEFWVGNYGSFDKMAAGVIRELKKYYPDIELNLVVPYLTKEINTHKEEYYKKYDDVLIARLPIGAPHRYKIKFCNEYMVDSSKYLIAYVNYSFGGAAKTLEYAERRSIKIFNFA